jgi:hypothetical protein
MLWGICDAYLETKESTVVLIQRVENVMGILTRIGWNIEDWGWDTEERQFNLWTG